MNKKKVFKNCILSLSLLLAISCGSDDNPTPGGNDDGNDGGGTVTLSSTKMEVDTSTEYQTIDGFGGINHPVWRGDLDEADRVKVFGKGDGQLGFSILRMHLDPNTNNWNLEVPTAKYAIDQGAIVFATPWDAPDNLVNDPTIDKPRVLPENYGKYVDHLNAFDDYMSDNGVPLYAISVQNEPDIGPWTQWTTTAMFNFVKNNAGDINARVIAPESFNFNRSYSNDILNDPIAVENIDIIGGHIYGNGQGEYALAEEKNKPIWMTEYLMNETDNNSASDDWSALTDSQIWDQSLDMLETVHTAMESNWNAYIWWYIKRYYSFVGDGQEGSTDGEILKRGYAFSHFSRFIRPEFKRVKITSTYDRDLQITAYRDSNKTYIIVINPNDEVVRGVSMGVDSEVPDSATMYITSLTKNVEKSTIDITSDGKLLYDMPAKSIVTLIIAD